MAIQIASAPSQAAEIVRRHLTLPATEAATVAAAAAGAASQPAHRMKPYPVYSARLENVVDRTLLKAAELTAWQYVVFRGQRIVALAEVAKGMPMRFASRQSPAVAEAVLAAIERAQKLGVVQKSDYELRLLRVPELYLLAVWLHKPGDDVLLPVRPFTRTLADMDMDGAAFTEKQIVEALMPIAAARTATPDDI